MARDVQKEIRETIDGSKVVIFMKGNAQAPMCGFSATAVRVFEVLGVPFQTVDVLQDPEIREGVKAFSKWPTIPQVYVDGKFLGGSDILREMYESGELEPLVKGAVQDSR
jgi:monothiol glutaredoxin